MPKLLTPELYKAIYNAAKRYFANATPEQLEPYRNKLNAGSALLRYVEYRNFLPQQEQAGRTIWTHPGEDKTNRWTGVDGNEQIGKQGLYLSLEEDGPLHTSFPEIEHYQDSTVPAQQEVSYFEYEAGNPEPKWQKSKVSELRTMFLFESEKEINGFNLAYDQDPDSIINQVFELARNETPAAFQPDDTVEKLYFHPDDASFNRAIGNAALEQIGIDYFTATSVRDRTSTNLILGAEQGKPIDLLKPQGRITFLIDGITKSTKSVYTVDDLIYNDIFDERGLETPLTKEELEKSWSHFEDFAKKIDGELSWEAATKKIDERIHNDVIGVLKNINDLGSQDRDALVKQILTNDLTKSIEQTLSEFVVTSSVKSEIFIPMYRDIGLEGVTSVLNKEIVEPQFEKLVKLDGAHNYLSLTIASQINDRLSHWLEEHAFEIQAKFLEANSTVTETSTELNTKQDTLTQLNEELLKKPEDNNLREQVDALRIEVEHLANELKDAETRRDQTENEITDNDGKKHDIAEESDRLREQREERRHELERR
ncbi:hypothetical protein [Paenibacillus sp. L3-i20]|uniref:hypothetical protein n=1 Tax=Paenibacillus sp. L3-i20 TaxID=2905833 RepID=UPI001EE0DEA6|nr:hypothetical protein [Paenibacillus sp. L3-i20]GKU78939.1 hypothetical protein L3i20_v233360 [Paenibacillus sp. L3-i20]